MRGKVIHSQLRVIVFRITPAYAGKSFRSSTADISRQDHPRLCGEKFFSNGITASVPGSPPPMRGKEIVR